MAVIVNLDNEGWLMPGRYRWLRALVYMIALAGSALFLGLAWRRGRFAA